MILNNQEILLLKAALKLLGYKCFGSLNQDPACQAILQQEGLTSIQHTAIKVLYEKVQHVK